MTNPGETALISGIVFFGGVLVVIVLVVRLLRALVRPYWIWAVVGLWLVWNLLPVSHPVMMHLWTDARRQISELLVAWRGLVRG